MHAALKMTELAWQPVASTIGFAFLGLALLVLFAIILNFGFKLDIRRELVEDHNTGLGVAVAGLAIAIAIIIAGTILS